MDDPKRAYDAAHLAELLEEVHWSAATLACVIGCPRHTVYRWLNGKAPIPYTVLYALGELLQRVKHVEAQFGHQP